MVKVRCPEALLYFFAINAIVAETDKAPRCPDCETLRPRRAQ